MIPKTPWRAASKLSPPTPSPYTKPSAAAGKNELKDEGGRMKDEKKISNKDQLFLILPPFTLVLWNSEVQIMKKMLGTNSGFSFSLHPSAFILCFLELYVLA
jgi:hypothetical protein